MALAATACFAPQHREAATRNELTHCGAPEVTKRRRRRPEEHRCLRGASRQSSSSHQRYSFFGFGSFVIRHCPVHLQLRAGCNQAAMLTSTKTARLEVRSKRCSPRRGSARSRIRQYMSRVQWYVHANCTAWAEERETSRLKASMAGAFAGYKAGHKLPCALRSRACQLPAP